MAIVTVFALVRPWSYWFAPPLLAAAALLALGFAVGYYRKVLVASFEWSLHESRQRLTQIGGASVGRAGRRRAGQDAPPLAA